MYLLMLLATYMAAMYQFNLSARPDYDRDVQKKRAIASVNKFIDHHKAAIAMAVRVSTSDNSGRDVKVTYMLPEDLLYVDNEGTGVDDNKNTHLFYYQKITNSKELFLLRKFNNNMQPQSPAISYLRLGRKLYDGNEMVSKVICLTNSMNCSGPQEQEKNDDGSDKYDANGNPIYSNEKCNGVAEMCVPPTDPTIDPTINPPVVTGTCCNRTLSKGGGYVVSFRKVDARWLNRRTGSVGMEFLKAIESKKFLNNVGMIEWDDDVDGGSWVFKGRMRFVPAYEKAQMDWEKNPDNGVFPTYMKDMTTWVLPNRVFDRDFFKVKIDGSGNSIDYCEKGCLFSIKSIL